MLSFLLLFYLIEVLRSSLKFLSFLCFYSHVYLMNMLFELVFRYVLLIVRWFHLVICEFHYIKLFGVVYFFRSQTFLKILV